MISQILDILRQAGGSSTRLKGEAIKTLLSLLTGEAPTMQYGEDSNGSYVKVTLSSSQNEFLRRYLEAWLDSAPGEIRVNVNPIIAPIIAKKSLPYALGGTALGAIFMKWRKKK